jgi:hypothetical protein
MKTCSLYGFILALAASFMTLMLYFLGFHSSAEKMDAAKWPGALVGLAIGVTIMALGVKARRDEVPAAEPFGYGRALWAGLLICIVSTALSAIFNYCYYAFINPGLSDLLLQQNLAKLEASGISGDKLDKMEAFNRMLFTPGWEAVFGVLAGLFFGLFIALILAAILKRPDPSELRA